MVITPISSVSADIRSVLESDERYSDVEQLIGGDEIWPVTATMARLLARLVVQRQMHSVLEFGAGRSSLILGHALSLASSEGRLLSLEHMPKFVEEAWTEVRLLPLARAELVPSHLALRVNDAGMYYEYDGAVPSLVSMAPFDLVLVDGPPFYFGRDGALHLCAPYLRAGSVIVVDDARRSPDRRTVARWLRMYDGLRLAWIDPTFGGHGAAVLVADKPLERTKSTGAMLEAAADWAWNWRHIRWKMRARRSGDALEA